MKIEAISTHERALIFQQLDQFGNWEKERMGAHIRIACYKSGGKTLVQFAIGRGSFNMHGTALELNAAIDEINKLIVGRPAGCLADLPEIARRFWPRIGAVARLPYKDAPEIEA